jgi:hypothetical protein
MYEILEEGREWAVHWFHNEDFRRAQHRLIGTVFASGMSKSKEENLLKMMDRHRNGPHDKISVLERRCNV